MVPQVQLATPFSAGDTPRSAGASPRAPPPAQPSAAAAGAAAGAAVADVAAAEAAEGVAAADSPASLELENAQLRSELATQVGVSCEALNRCISWHHQHAVRLKTAIAHPFVPPHLIFRLCSCRPSLPSSEGVLWHFPDAGGHGVPGRAGARRRRRRRPPAAGRIKVCSSPTAGGDRKAAMRCRGLLSVLISMSRLDLVAGQGMLAVESTATRQQSCGCHLIVVTFRSCHISRQGSGGSPGSSQRGSAESLRRSGGESAADLSARFQAALAAKDDVAQRLGQELAEARQQVSLSVCATAGAAGCQHNMIAGHLRQDLALPDSGCRARSCLDALQSYSDSEPACLLHDASCGMIVV